VFPDRECFEAHLPYAAAASKQRKTFMSDFLNFADMGKVTVIYIYQHMYAHNKTVSFPALPNIVKI
jgi:hypothetical protein